MRASCWADGSGCDAVFLEANMSLPSSGMSKSNYAKGHFVTANRADKSHIAESWSRGSHYIGASAILCLSCCRFMNLDEV
jgi:hypothetical protein